ncbi:MAG: TrkH family potassium uptake protein, partial [Muribaculaceae bacterium]|nr:TrkH family potassium uptake protein [Muribaculaceae bacterium]
SMLMMFIGACAGSTTGGAKIDRIIYLFKNSRNELYRNLYPNAILPVKINNRVVSPELVNKVVAFLCMYVVLVIAGGLIISAMGVPMLDSFFSAFSCMSNTGLDAGITGYGSSFATLPAAAKWVLTALMLTGRLEIFTILLLLTPAFWRR